MKRIVFHFDLVSPYAYLAFERLPQALEGCSYAVEYRPLLLAGLLQAWGQLGPAEVAPKREWTYRQIAWLAHGQAIPLSMPASHPFNSLALLRLLLAHGLSEQGPGGSASRWAIDQAFRQVWRTGAEAGDEAALTALAVALRPGEPDALIERARRDDVKALLRANTVAATAHGVFGVPTCEVDGKLFWGFDALPMLAAYLRGDEWFAEGNSWDTAVAVPVGVTRNPVNNSK